MFFALCDIVWLKLQEHLMHGVNKMQALKISRKRALIRMETFHLQRNQGLQQLALEKNLFSQHVTQIQNTAHHIIDAAIWQQA